MSIPTNKQNLNEKDFTPDHSTDDHNIQYSCGHINPLQRALANNGVEKLNSIKANLEKAIEDITYFTNEILSFAEKRCEAIRSVNQELRNAVDDGCGCEPNYDNCPYCENLRDEKDDLESEKSELESEVATLNDKVEELENLIQGKQKLNNEVSNSLKNMEKKFSMVKNLVENLEEL